MGSFCALWVLTEYFDRNIYAICDEFSSGGVVLLVLVI
jgi:hypothetical protein